MYPKHLNSTYNNTPQDIGTIPALPNRIGFMHNSYCENSTTITIKNKAMLIDDFLSSSAQTYPEKEAIVTEKGRFSYREVNELANKISNSLISAKFNKGDRAIIYMENSLEVVASLFGILKAGGVFVIVNPHIRLKKLIYLLNNCTASALITSSDNFQKPEEIFRDVSSLQTIVTDKNDFTSNKYPAQQSIICWQDIINSSEGIAPDYRNIPTNLAALIYTSGTTGNPKGVMLTHLNMIAASSSIIEYLESTKDDIVLNVHPLSFDYGLYQVLMSFKVGGTVVLLKNYGYPYSVIKCLQEEKITGFPIVPTIASLLGDMNNLSSLKFPHLRYITNTGDKLHPSHITTIQETFPNTKVFSMYGLTECKRVSYLPPELLTSKPSSVGVAMPKVEAFIVDELGNTVGPNVEGELVVRGPNVMHGYWNNIEETAKRLKPVSGSIENVLFTNDTFTLDEDGHLYFIRRNSDILKVKGQAISPKEIENVIANYPNVKEVVIIGIPNKKFGHKIKAIITASDIDKLNKKDIERFCSQHLENISIPHIIEFRRNLPRTENGKINKKLLSKHD